MDKITVRNKVLLFFKSERCGKISRRLSWLLYLIVGSVVGGYGAYLVWVLLFVFRLVPPFETKIIIVISLSTTLPVFLCGLKWPGIAFKAFVICNVLLALAISVYWTLFDGDQVLFLLIFVVLPQLILGCLCRWRNRHLDVRS